MVKRDLLEDARVHMLVRAEGLQEGDEPLEGMHELGVWAVLEMQYAQDGELR
jgi:hypothetical protein